MGANDLFWLELAREIQALSQTGIHYASNNFDLQRYHRLQEISAEIISRKTDLDKRDMLRILINQSGYATPKIDVRGAVFKENKLLLVEEIKEKGWTLPGGWADVGDLPSHAVEREVFEESGFIVRAKKVIGIYDGNRIDPLELFHAYKIVFYCEIMGGEEKISDETSQVRFFGINEIPSKFSGERTKQRHIDDAFRNYFEEETFVIFD
ncbi:MAG: NUDIX hydrolase [Anaerolineales bacterium]|jgi:ADP-ribose pyrophosphatase YjhB (NUDIX family)